MLDKRAVFINTASQILVRFVTLALTLISVKLLSNYLGTDGLGSYNTITTYINFFIVIADLGLFSATVREISKKPQDETKILANVFVIRFISAVIASLAALSIVYLTDYSQEIKTGTLLATGFLFFNLLGSVYDMVLQSRLKMQYSALAEFLSKAFSIIALYLIILAEGNFFAVMSTVALYGLLIFIFKWLFASKFIIFGPKYNKDIAKWIFNLSWPFGIVFIMNNIFMKIDSLLLFALKGSAAAGIYTIAYKILEVSAFMGSYFTNSLKPAISRSMNNDKKTVSEIIQKSMFFSLLLALPITISAIIFPTEIILFLSNSDFLPGKNALILLALTLPFIFFDVLLSEIYIANNERALMVKIFIFIVSFNIIGNLILIPHFSYNAAAFTTLLSEILLLIINIKFTRKIVPFTIPFKEMGKLVLAGAATLMLGLIYKTTGLHFIFLIALVFATFGGVILGSKIVTISNIKGLLRG